VRLDLGAVGLKAQAQAGRRRRFDHAAGKGLPVEVGPGRQVGVVVAHGAVHLGQQGHAGDALARGLQAHDDVGQLLADRRGAGGLAVGAAEHGHAGVLVGQLAQALDHDVQPLQQHGAAGLQLQRMAGVVDVLAGAGKVHELAGGLQFGVTVELGFDPVFDGLDVVVGGALDGLDGGAVGFAKTRQQRLQVGAGLGRQGLELGKAGVGQGHEPGQLDLHAVAHVAQLAHQRAQGSQLGGIAAIERRNGGQRGEFHALNCKKASPTRMPAPVTSGSIRPCPCD